LGVIIHWLHQLVALPSVPYKSEGEAVTMAMPPVLYIMAELQELCTNRVLPLSLKHVKVHPLML
jgi:hypothetical protein